MIDGPASAPLTVGTAGHVDHGKTTLVRALTGVDTDRLPEERARGLTIVLGFAALTLGSGRRLSLVDVPGHERFVGVMVSGAGGIDLFLLVVAADDGPMPQTTEHLRVLRALDVRRGVVAVTKSDRADPGPAVAAVRRLLPGAPVVACAARTGRGVAEVAAALAGVAAETPSRSLRPGPPALHVDRVFSIRGAGTVVTGTLSRGAIAPGDHLRLLPSGRPVRVRGVQVHDAAVERADAGQRVAVNLARIDRAAVARGDALVGMDSPLAPAFGWRAELELAEPLAEHERVQVHHGTRSVPARVDALDDGSFRLRASAPLLVAPGDRLVVRRIAPPDTLGGGIVTSVAGRRRPVGSSPSPARVPPSSPSPPEPPLDGPALALEERLRAAGHEPLDARELEDGADHLPALVAAGRAVRVGRSLYAHPGALDAVAERAREVIARDGAVTLAGLRDELRTSRRYAQALLEHLDAARVTRRLPDDRRVLRRRA